MKLSKYLLLAPLTLTACEIPAWLQGGLETLVFAIAGALAALVTALGMKLNQYLTSKIKNTKISNSVSVIDELIQSVVMALIESYKEKLAAAIKDGKIDKKERDELKTLAVDVIKSRFNTDALKKIAASLDLTPQAAEAYITDKVVAAIGFNMDSLPFNLGKTIKKTKVVKKSK